jgi:hypothetical protein
MTNLPFPESQINLPVNLLRTQNNLSKLLNSLMNLTNLHQCMIVEWMPDRQLGTYSRRLIAAQYVGLRSGARLRSWH